MSIERPHSAPIELCAPNPFIGSDEANVIGLVNCDDLLVVLLGSWALQIIIIIIDHRW